MIRFKLGWAGSIAKCVGWAVAGLLFDGGRAGTGWGMPLPQTNPSSGQESLPATPLALQFQEDDREVARQLLPILERGRDRIEAFFGKPFSQTFTIEIAPNRAAFDEYFQRRWNLPQTERWMVASGVGDHLIILSPRVWKAEAAEHDPADAERLADLVAHELVHVYHGQRNARPDFDQMDELGWFIEGLAVYVSGQLEHAHAQSAGTALAAGSGPQDLATVWSGKYRYGVAGSLVAFVVGKYGKPKLIELLAASDNAAVLRQLGTTESALLDEWKQAVLAEK